jgi:tankyrase
MFTFTCFLQFIHSLSKFNQSKIYFADAMFVCLVTGFGRRDVVEHLIATGANVHARDDGGLIPLHNACSFGHAEVVQLLLSAGADPNARDNWSYTPLHEAAIKGKIDVCIVLLQHGADHNIRNAEGMQNN